VSATLLLLYPGCVSYEVLLAAELLHPIHQVEVVTPDGQDHIATGGVRMRATRALGEVDPTAYAFVLVPGGDPGDLLENDAASAPLRRLHDDGATLGAICAGPLLLALAGLLKGRRFTHGYGEAHREFLEPFWRGAVFVPDLVVGDGRIVTAQPQAHVDFGIELASRAGAFRDDEEREYRRRFYKGAVSHDERVARWRAGTPAVRPVT